MFELTFQKTRPLENKPRWKTNPGAALHAGQTITGPVNQPGTTSPERIWELESEPKKQGSKDTGEIKKLACPHESATLYLLLLPITSTILSVTFFQRGAAFVRATNKPPLNFLSRARPRLPDKSPLETEDSACPSSGDGLIK